MPNIYDVAREAGVSRSTVSRVINNQKSVKPEKKERVMEAIEKLNYTPNATARALAMNKTNTIGIISRDLTDMFNTSFIKQIHDCADAMHYGAIFCMQTAADKANINYIDFLNKKVDGFIFIGENTINEKELNSLIQADIPVIILEVVFSNEKGTYITVNNEKASYNSINYLYSLGHRRIAHISNDDNTQEKWLRYKGYKDAIYDLSLEFERMYDVPYEIEDSRPVVKRLVPMLIRDKVTAAFCYNNSIATALAEGLIQAGIRIPEDFSIIGFDDIHYSNISKVTFPRLTSNLQPQRLMAQYAVDCLLKLIDRPKGEELYSLSKEFECRLMIYESTQEVIR